MPQWLDDLDRIKAEFGTKAASRKQRILAAARRTRIRDAESLRTYHEALCFLRAFPDDPGILRATERELRAFARRVGPLKEELAGTGIAGTTYGYPFSLPMAAWLVDRFGEAVEIDWDIYDERENDNLAATLSPVAGWVETAALDDESLSAREWFARCRGRRRANSLRRLVDRLRTSDLPVEAPGGFVQFAGSLVDVGTRTESRVAYARENRREEVVLSRRAATRPDEGPAGRDSRADAAGSARPARPGPRVDRSRALRALGA